MAHMNAIGDTNSGFVERAKAIALSRQCTLRGRLHNEFLRQERYLISQCSLRLKLTCNNQEFPLMTADGSKYKLSITSARFEIPKLKLNPATALDMERQLKVTPAKYPIRRGEIKTFSIAAGTMNVTKENLFASVPRRIIVGMVTAKAFNGLAKLNPFDFQHFGINHLAIYIDGQRTPARALAPDFAGGNYARSFDLLLQATGRDEGNEARDLQPHQFGKGHTLFGIPLTAGIGGFLTASDCFRATGIEVRGRFDRIRRLLGLRRHGERNRTGSKPSADFRVLNMDTIQLEGILKGDFTSEFRLTHMCSMYPLSHCPLTIVRFYPVTEKMMF